MHHLSVGTCCYSDKRQLICSWMLNVFDSVNAQKSCLDVLDFIYNLSVLHITIYWHIGAYIYIYFTYVYLCIYMQITAVSFCIDLHLCSWWLSHILVFIVMSSDRQSHALCFPQPLPDFPELKMEQKHDWSDKAWFLISQSEVRAPLAFRLSTRRR